MRYPTCVPPRIGLLAGWMMALLVCLPLTAPLLAEGIPATGDGYLHLQRIVLLDDLARHGAPFARWLPSVAYGFGFPVFSYYGILSYLPAQLALWLGASYVTAYKLTLALILIGAGVSMFALASRVLRLEAAIVSAIAYAYAPYLLVDVYVRGALAEAATFIWLPLVGLSLIETRRRDGTGPVAATALCVAALVCTHNATALFAMPILALLALLLAVSRRPYAPTVDWRFAGRAGLGFALGLAASAWFWLPALAESRLVNVAATIDRDALSKFLIRGWPPLQTSVLYDYSQPRVEVQGFEWPWPTVGLVQGVLFAIGTLGAVATRGQVRVIASWAALTGAGAWFLQLAAARPLYDTIPMFAFVQYPWRLLTFFALAASLLAGVSIESIGSKRMAAVTSAGALCALLVWSALARVEPVYDFPRDEDLTPDGVLRAELADYGFGTTHFGEYLPVSSGFDSRDRLRRRLMGAPAPSAAADVPLAARIEALEWGPTRAVWNLETSVGERLTVHQFMFPGWTAWIDGVRQTPAADSRFGALTIDVPKGAHTVEIAYGATTTQIVGGVVSVIAVAALVVWRWRRRGALVGLAVVGVCCAAWLASTGAAVSPTRAFTSTEPSEVLAGRLTALAIAVEPSPRLDSRIVRARVGWLVRSPLPQGIDLTLVLTADNAVQQARWSYGQLSRQWIRGELVATETDLRIPAEFPAGAATLTAIVRARGEVDASLVNLGTVTIASPSVARSSITGRPTWLLTYDVLRLESAELSPSGSMLDISPPGLVRPTMGWYVEGFARVEPTVTVQLRGGRAGPASSATVGSWYAPAGGWQAGDRFSQQLAIVVGRDVADGVYEAWLRLDGRERPWIVPAPEDGASGSADRPRVEVSIGRVTVRR